MIETLLLITRLYEVVLIARVLLSWIGDQRLRYHVVYRWIYLVTEPVLEPLRRVLPGRASGIDFSPLAVLLALEIVRKAFFRTIMM